MCGRPRRIHPVAAESMMMTTNYVDVVDEVKEKGCDGKTELFALYVIEKTLGIV